MLDTMTFTKVIGGLCGTFLIFLLGGFFAEFIYHDSGHGAGDHKQGYMIATDSGGAAEEAVEVAFADVYAAADAGAGEKIFKKCKACHALEAGKNGTGPSLLGIVDRSVGTEAGFGYSGKLVAVADSWTPENLSAFIEDPKGFAPGTKMSFKGIKKVEDRANLIAWLKSLGQ